MNIEERNKWIGIIIGASLIAAGPFIGHYRMDVAPYSVIFFLIGGFIAGIFSSGNVMDGIKSASMSGLIGSAFIGVISILSIISSFISGTVGYMAGWVLLFIPIFTVLSIIIASVGAVLGATIRKIWRKNK
jgi:hypothetical protein